MNRIIFSFLLFFCTNFLYANDFHKVIYIIPPGGYEEGRLFDLNNKVLNRDDCIKHFYDLRTALRQLGYELKTAYCSDDLSDGEYILTSGITGEAMYTWLSRYSGKLIAFIWEPPTVEPVSYERRFHDIFSKIYIMDDDFVDNKKYRKLYYPQPDLQMLDDIPSFDKKQFCTLINSFGKPYLYPEYPFELYTERLRAIEYFSKKDGFKFYGKNWKQSSYFSSTCYGGTVVKKKDVLKNFKFCICFENTSNMLGYVTEKIFDCMVAGCVPVYLGAPNITEYVPKDCFIDFRDFEGYSFLYNFLVNITKQDYEKYLLSIKKFLYSNKATKFSIDFFVEIFINDTNLKKDE